MNISGSSIAVVLDIEMYSRRTLCVRGVRWRAREGQVCERSLRRSGGTDGGGGGGGVDDQNDDDAGGGDDNDDDAGGGGDDCDDDDDDDDDEENEDDDDEWMWEEYMQGEKTHVEAKDNLKNECAPDGAGDE